MGGGEGFLGWLGTTALSQAMRGNLWLYPIVEIFHIVGFTILVGSVALFDLRVLGLSKTLPIQALGRHLLHWAVASLLLIVPAGLMMFSAHPHDFANNKVFLLKLTLIGIAGVNAFTFHAGVYRTAGDWDRNVSAPTRAKLHAALSLLLWISVIACGRLLAYT